MLTLNNIKSPKGAHRNTKRIGRGQGSGWGTQAGKGHKGQKARSGGGVRLGYEGGQMPIYMRLPKRGFSNYPFKTEYAIVTLDQIQAKFDSETVNRETLIEKGLLSGVNKRLPIKILVKGDFTKGLTFSNIDKFSKSAEQMISKAGGTIESKEAK
ncbi:MAG: 50S ribosomal protein L15 [Bacteriovoracaceae bacterium]|jgi:large subunit ribosomal protein L15|nr:50S ribosomal protein L15 [Bacteriovoracaceae bacterium]